MMLPLNHKVNEMWLFHGTSYDKSDQIVRSGFERIISWAQFFNLLFLLKGSLWSVLVPVQGRGTTLGDMHGPG